MRQSQRTEELRDGIRDPLLKLVNRLPLPHGENCPNSKKTLKSFTTSHQKGSESNLEDAQTPTEGFALGNRVNSVETIRKIQRKLFKSSKVRRKCVQCESQKALRPLKEFLVSMSSLCRAEQRVCPTRNTKCSMNVGGKKTVWAQTFAESIESRAARSQNGALLSAMETSILCEEESGRMRLRTGTVTPPPPLHTHTNTHTDTALWLPTE